MVLLLFGTIGRMKGYLNTCIEMNEQVYKKVRGRYVQLGYSDGYSGFPAEGIWAVYDRPGCKSSTCIASVGSIKPIDYSLLASLIADKEEPCLRALEEVLTSSKGYSRVDIVKCIFETILDTAKTNEESRW